MARRNPTWIRPGDGFTDVDLSRPLEIAGAQVSALRMREPTVGDQRAASAAGGGTDIGEEIALFANTCEITPADLDKLPLRDYRRLQVAFLGFTD